jgi:hypothetical protein
MPPVAIDSESGRAKINQHAEALGWPTVLKVDALTDLELERTLDLCLTEEACAEARRCRDDARQTLGAVLEELSSFLAEPSPRSG